MKEYKIQIEVCKFLFYLQDKYQFRYFHVPNQGIRSISNKMLLIKMGMKPGCPDLIIEFPKLLERPNLVSDFSAIIGWPPANVFNLL